MKFNCYKNYEEKNARLEKKLARLTVWHRWFAWHPIKISNHDCRWLEWVMRKGEYHCTWGEYFWNWSYQSNDNGQK